MWCLFCSLLDKFALHAYYVLKQPFMRNIHWQQPSTFLKFFTLQKNLQHSQNSLNFALVCRLPLHTMAASLVKQETKNWCQFCYNWALKHCISMFHRSSMQIKVLYLYNEKKLFYLAKKSKCSFVFLGNWAALRKYSVNKWPHELFTFFVKENSLSIIINQVTTTSIGCWLWDTRGFEAIFPYIRSYRHLRIKKSRRYQVGNSSP